MLKEQLITAEQVEKVRFMLKRSLEDPVNGKFFKGFLYKEIQSMVGMRVSGKYGKVYPKNPNDMGCRDFVYEQRACEIYDGKVIIGKDAWENHEDIRVRGEIPSTEFRVSGEQFFMRNLPQVPIIRCDAKIPEKDLQGLKKNYVLLDSSLEEVY